MAKQSERKPRMMLDRERAMYWYNMGLNDKQIAEKCDVGKQAVYTWRTQMCLPPNARIRRVRKMSSLDWNAIQARKHGVTYGQWMTPAFETERERLLKEKY